ncbi:MAG: DUF262 domain-containing protein [Erythrobacter sp.]|uniref:DUF262 domain-containing protein n=1 Tax=Erythrobacter sp. TaxID=1042 RepID=UPI0032676359
MDTPLNASASAAGAVFSNSIFEVPQFQREYSWTAKDEVADFWLDLSGSLGSDVYFLGLLILTSENDRSHVVDGQQRLISLSLLAAALYHEALSHGRDALADRISAAFLKSINFDTDAKEPRVFLSHAPDNETFQLIVNTGEAPSTMFGGDTVSAKIVESFNFLRSELRKDLSSDPFKRMGLWAEFLTKKLYFAVFMHPDPAAAYQVFEVVNTRGKELTTSDLLKNYLLSQTKPEHRENRYERWQSIASNFASEGSNNFVQFIRHVITVHNGHVLPKDLYAFLAGRMRNQEGPPHAPGELMEIFEDSLRLYLQMIDPSAAGPGTEGMLAAFGSLNSLGVIAVRPMLIAIAGTPDPEAGMTEVVKLVVRRVAVGSLGTGNVERRFGEAANKIFKEGNWQTGLDDLRDLVPPREDFETQLSKRSYNKSTLTFLRQSTIQNTMFPQREGSLHFVFPRQADEWVGMDEDARSFWHATIGNSLLAKVNRRAPDSSDWEGFQTSMLPLAVDGEIVDALALIPEWNVEAVSKIGQELAQRAANVWY